MRSSTQASELTGMTARRSGGDPGFGEFSRRCLLLSATPGSIERVKEPGKFPPGGWKRNDNTISKIVLPIILVIFDRDLFHDGSPERSALQVTRIFVL
jgi:hypothetical protein